MEVSQKLISVGIVAMVQWQLEVFVSAVVLRKGQDVMQAGIQRAMVAIAGLEQECRAVATQEPKLLVNLYTRYLIRV
jgi:hypothetical protein